jgi:integrase
MPRTVPADRRYLEMHGASWRVTVVVPVAARGIMKTTRLRYDLKTDSLRQANLTKKRHVERFRAQINAALAKAGNKRHQMEHEASELAKWRIWAKEHPQKVTEADWETWRECVGLRATEIRGEGAVWHDGVPVQNEDDDDMSGWEFNRESFALGTRFQQIAKGEETPLDVRHGEYLTSIRDILNVRTVADDARAVRYLLQWLAAEDVSPSIELITTMRAHAFAEALPGLANIGPATANKYLSRLSSYWQWLAKKEPAAAVNPWVGVALGGSRRRDDEKERAFSNGEVALLLGGPATPHMYDLMMIGALTGARLDAIVDLKVRDVSAATIQIQARKLETKDRLVPIHPDLREVLARRCNGKKPDDDLFPEWPPVRKVGSLRERSFKASNHFTDYRRKVGVDDVMEGHRRALVNFHSFRRWFVTRIRQAGVEQEMVSAIVGHKQTSITLSIYSDGETIKKAAEAVELLRIPGKNGEPIEEPQTVNVRRRRK